MKKSVDCKCGGKMFVQKGSETARQLVCDLGGGYWYKVGGINCVCGGCDCSPKNTKAGEKLLDEKGANTLTPETIAKIKKLGGENP